MRVRTVLLGLMGALNNLQIADLMSDFLKKNNLDIRDK